jgi:hypothetical protein
MIAFLIILGLVAVGMIIGLIAVAAAPDGYQDETGFHYGPEHDQKEEVFAGQVTEPRLA